MTTIAAMLERVKSLELRDSVPTIIQEQAKTVIAYNQRQLYDHGQRADGEQLQDYRSEFYAIEKNRRNAKPGFGVPDLYDTGSFYRSMQLDVDKKTFELDSTDPKSSDLKKKYGDAIFGLTPISAGQYARGEFFASLKEYIERKTGLKFT